MFMPNGQSANNIDRAELIALWATYLKSQSQAREILAAGMDKPFFPNHVVAFHGIRYWNEVQSKGANARDALSEMYRSKEEEASALRDQVATCNGSIPCGQPQGQEEVREKIAGILNNWYPGLSANAKDLILPMGETGGRCAIFDFIHEKKHPEGVIITTPVPSYHQGNNRQNRLQLIQVLKEPGYKFTAQALQESITVAKKKNLPVNAFLFCTPTNPIGSVTDKSEWEKIAAVLREFLAHEKDLSPDKKTPIVLYEVYAELGMGKSHVSLLTVAPDLAEHFILMRATMGLAPVDEPTALIFSQNKYFINECLIPGINGYGHAPVSAQKSFAEGLYGLTKNRLDEMAIYYQPKFKWIQQRAQHIGVNMPDERYAPEDTFYILLDLSDLIGQPLHEGAKRAVGEKSIIQTDEDICYHLLFENNIMICPGSYFGLNPSSGFVPIACTGGDTQLSKIMDGIHAQIINARVAKRKKLLAQLFIARANISAAIDKYSNSNDALLINNLGHSSLTEQAYQLMASASEHIASRDRYIDLNQSTEKMRFCFGKELKNESAAIEKILLESAALILELDPVKKREHEKANQSATKIQAVFKGHAHKERYQSVKEKKAVVQGELDRLNQAELKQYGSKLEKKAALQQGIAAVHTALEHLNQEEIKICGTKRSIITTHWQTSGLKKESEQQVKKLGFGLSNN